MFTGHYGPSFAGKALDKDNRIPLWLLFIAVQFIDVLWSIFVLLGIEKVRIVPGITAASPLDLYYMPYTHSLAGVLGWSLLAFLVCQAVPRWRGVRGAAIVAAAVFSHWVLDLIVHRPDLTLYGGGLRMGFGLWNHRVLSFVVEMAVLFGGAAMYLKSAAHKVRLVVFVLFLAAFQVLGTFMVAPPPSDRAEALSALSSYLVLAAIAAWVDAGGKAEKADTKGSAMTSARATP